MCKKLILTILLALSESIKCEDSSSETRITHDDGNIQELMDEDLILHNAQNIPSEGSGSLDNSVLEGNDDFRHVSDQKICIESGFDTVCSGQGECIDGRCICNSSESVVEENNTVAYRFSGKYCEECPFCNGRRCHNFLPCIECHLIQKSENCDSHCQFQYAMVDQVIRNVDNDEKFCDVETSNGCFIKFKYHYNTHNIVVVEYEKSFLCFNGYRLAMFVFWGVIGYIFALGLLVPRLCFLPGSPKMDSRTSLSRRCDVLRMNPTLP